MSRYELAPLPNTSGITGGTVGWDPPLATFFAQIFKHEDGEDITFLWEGLDYGEIPEAETVIDLVAPHCAIPPNLLHNLTSDQLDTAGHRDGPAQAAARSFIQRNGNSPDG